jgi:hypothetical protein
VGSPRSDGFATLSTDAHCRNTALPLHAENFLNEKKTENSNSEVVAALLMQDIQQYLLVRRVPQLMGTFRRNVKPPFIV